MLHKTLYRILFNISAAHMYDNKSGTTVVAIHCYGNISRHLNEASATDQ